MSVQKITLFPSRDIPFNKLVLTQTNVRQNKLGISIDDLAADIAERGLLQSLSVRPLIEEDGAETGMYEVPAGGRRYRALELLIKQKRLTKTAPVPCVVKPADSVNSAKENSLEQIVERNLNIQPTLTARFGLPVTVTVDQDLILEPYGQEAQR